MKHSTSARGLSALIATAALAAGGIAVSAQSVPGPPDAGPVVVQSRDLMPLNDAEFVRAMSAANTAELEAAKYVLNRTKDASVHAFSQRMVDDHSSAAVKLSAATRGVNLAPVPPAREANLVGAVMVTQLQGLAGTEMDTRYMRMQVPAHRRVLALLQWETQNGKVPTVQTFATQTIPTVQTHLQVAQGYLAEHNLTPYVPTADTGGPGNAPNPMSSGSGTVNNPAAPGSHGSTSGQEGGAGGTTRNPLTPPTPGGLGGTGTAPPPGGSPAPGPT